MNKLYILFIFTFLFVSISQGNSSVIKKNNSYYFADRIIVKFKDNNSLEKRNPSFYKNIGITNITQTFQIADQFQSNARVLQNIFTLQFSSPYELQYILKLIKKDNNVEWAEPQYLYETSFVPNDPNFTTSQQYLSVIKAQQAWDVNTGSEEVIVAIIDTGIDWAHPDLAGNIWVNSLETDANGVDDDNNGFVDDIRGWDFGGLSGTPDNNPKEDRADHGTLVAGLASAVTNNSIGIASIGYKSKLMAVKTSQDDIRSESGGALIAYGYEGIVYAVDNGAKIINCSWGGGSFSFAAQSVIDYAVSKGALVVAAAGNDNSSQGFYPANYDGVLSVGATDNSDNKAWFSNYGTKIDVCAPGVNVYSTWQDSPFYDEASGTSLSSPIVAGLAALVANQFPSFSPLQIAEQIRVTSDNIDNINSTYSLLLGSGRINAYQALTKTNSKSVRISEIAFVEVGDGDGIFESGESVKIVPTFINYLNPLVNLSAVLESNSSDIQITNNSGNLGSATTLQYITTGTDAFVVSINSNAQDNIDINLKFTYQDVNYFDFEWITISINPTYEIHTTENLEITFNSSGSIGFDDFPTNLKGGGLKFNGGPNLMFEGALLYGNSSSTIIGSARNNHAEKDPDFLMITPISINVGTEFADKEGYAKFNDSSAPNSLGIETDFYTYSFSGNENADYIFVRYSFKNKTLENIDNFYVGQYWDFDMDNTSYDDDMVGYDNVNKFGYVHDDDGNPISTHIGLALLSEGSTSFFAMNDKGEGNPTISWDGFTDEEKWTALTSGMNYPTSGPNDISVLVSGGPYSIEPDIYHNVDFLVAAGDGLDKLTQTILTAKQKYSEVVTDLNFDDTKLAVEFELSQNYPNPFNPTTTIIYSIPKAAVGLNYVTLKIYDILGKEIATLVNESKPAGKYTVEFNAELLPSGVYFSTLRSNNFEQTKKILLLK